MWYPLYLKKGSSSPSDKFELAVQETIGKADTNSVAKINVKIPCVEKYDSSVIKVIK